MADQSCSATQQPQQTQAKIVKNMELSLPGTLTSTVLQLHQKDQDQDLNALGLPIKASWTVVGLENYEQR